MNTVLKNELVLLIQICCLLQNILAYYYSSDQNQDTQSQENESNVDEKQEHNHRRRSSHHFHHQSGKENNMLRYTNYDDDECNSCACNKCDNPPECCTEVCNNCPQSLMSKSQIQMMPMAEMFQMQQPSVISQIANPIADTQMAQMPNPQMQMPQMQMQQMPSMLGQFQIPFPGQYPGQNLLYYPFASQFMSFLNNMPKPMAMIQPSENMVVSATSTATTAEATTATTKEVTSTTPATTTTTTTTTTPIPTTTPELQTVETKSPLNFNVETETDRRKALESIIKNAINALSDIAKRETQKIYQSNDRNLRTTPLRRTNPNFPIKSKLRVPKFDIVPIPNNMAEKLMLQMRGVKSIRPTSKI